MERLRRSQPHQDHDPGGDRVLSAAFCFTYCLPDWFASATSASSPIESVNTSFRSAGFCSPSAHPPFPPVLTEAKRAAFPTRMLAQSANWDGWSSSNSSQPDPSQYRTPHDIIVPPRSSSIPPVPMRLTVHLCVWSETRGQNFFHNIGTQGFATLASDLIPVRLCPSHCGPRLPPAKTDSLPSSPAKLSSMNSIGSARAD